MGHYTSRFHHGQSALEVSNYSRAYEPEWIVDHSRVSGLTLLQTERLWQRFQQLGSTDGTLKPMQMPLKMKTDAFSRIILSKLQDEEHTIRFLTFCNFFAWLDTSNTEVKAKAVFQLLGKGNDIKKDHLYTILKNTFTSETDASVYKLTDIVFRAVDENGQGYINEEQWVQFLKRMPDAQLKRMLSFSIIPEYIDLNPKEQEQIQDTYRPTTSSEHSKQIPTDFILMEVAQKACRRDWYMLGNLLDFTSNSLSQFEQLHNEPRDQAFSMLKAWRDREGKRAHLIRLEKALRQAGMNDIAMILQP